MDTSCAVGVSKTPGPIALKPIPSGVGSLPGGAVKLTMPPLEAQYLQSSWMTDPAPIDAILMLFPFASSPII